MGRGQEFFVADFWSKAEKMRYKDTSWPKLLSTFFNKFKQISPNNNITSNDKKIIVGKNILLIVFSDYYLYLCFVEGRGQRGNVRTTLRSNISTTLNKWRHPFIWMPFFLKSCLGGFAKKTLHALLFGNSCH